jgi:hypothetical protein
MDMRSPHSLPFAGREKELEALLELHRQRRSVLIVGSAGVGKSALLRQAGTRVPVLVVDQTTQTKRLYRSVRTLLHATQTTLGVFERRRSLIEAIQASGRVLVFDSVADTTKSAAEFILDVNQTVPVWIVCRSDLPHEIGRVSENLSDFVRLSLPPLKLTEVRSLIAQCVQIGKMRKDALAHVPTLYSVCCGNPRIFTDLLAELSRPEYKAEPSFEHCLQRLKGDRVNLAQSGE